MANKNQEEKPESTEPEPAEVNAEMAESTQANSQSVEDEISAEDLLEDVRRSLIEEETEKTHKQDSKWWRRIGRKGKSSETEAPSSDIEIDLPALQDPVDTLEETQVENKETDEYLDSIDELIDALETESEEKDDEAPAVASLEVPPEPEPKIDFETLKEQAFRPRAPEEEPESLTDVRSIALEGGEEVFVEVEAPVADPMQERISAFENALKPYRRYIYAALTILGVGMAVVAALILFNLYRQSQPQAVRETPNLPYPTAVSLPGGWSFQLGQGTLEAGRWDPQGPEWLEGTEVCRWVALPWSPQLEAVFRTLNPKDPIELIMSNNDKLVYGVYSIRELSMEEIQELDSNSPCLLLILTQSESDKHWVLTALP